MSATVFELVAFGWLIILIEAPVFAYYWRVTNLIMLELNCFCHNQIRSPSTMIGHVLRTVRITDRHAKCPICRDTFTRPVEIKVCGHAFCDVCIRTTLASMDTCPLDMRCLFPSNRSTAGSRRLAEVVCWPLFLLLRRVDFFGEHPWLCTFLKLCCIVYIGLGMFRVQERRPSRAFSAASLGWILLVLSFAVFMEYGTTHQRVVFFLSAAFWTPIFIA